MALGDLSTSDSYLERYRSRANKQFCISSFGELFRSQLVCHKTNFLHFLALQVPLYYKHLKKAFQDKTIFQKESLFLFY